MYTVKNGNLFAKGKIINGQACRVIIDTKSEIAQGEQEIAALVSQLNAATSVNEERKKLVTDLLAAGFCECNQTHQNKDPLTGQQVGPVWFDHKDGCRNKKRRI